MGRVWARDEADPMTTMIERIARGLAIADNRGDDWQQYTDKAAGVLRLIREPTRGMVNYVLAHAAAHYYLPEDIWRDMVDAASAEEPTNASQ